MLLTYYCDTQKQSSGEFGKVVGKQLCRSLFFSKVAGRLKKRLRHSVLSEHFQKTVLDIKLFFELLFYRYSRNISIFFQVIRLFLLLMSSFQTMKPRHVDKTYKQHKTAIILTKYSCEREHYEN